MIVQYNFNVRNQPRIKIQMEVKDNLTRVYVPGARDIVIVPEGTGLDITIDLFPTVSDMVGQIEVMRS